MAGGAIGEAPGTGPAVPSRGKEPVGRGSTRAPLRPRATLFPAAVVALGLLSLLLLLTTTTTTVLSVLLVAALQPHPRSGHLPGRLHPRCRHRHEHRHHPPKWLRDRWGDDPQPPPAALGGANARAMHTTLWASGAEPGGWGPAENDPPPAAGNGDGDYTWIWEDQDGGSSGKSGHRGTWRKPEPGTRDAGSARIVATIRAWCEGFVSELDLCPWARASVGTPGAMRFFLVPPPEKASETERAGGLVHSAAERFRDEVLGRGGGDSDSDSKGASPPPSPLERAAIYFVVFLGASDRAVDDPAGAGRETIPGGSSLSSSFPEYLDWFMDLEDDWPEDLEDDVIVAPFHPGWEFGDTGGGEDLACLDYEKRSPYALVSLVSTRVVETAGEAVTGLIGEHNEDVLVSIEAKARTNQGHPSVADLWRSALYGRR